MDANWCQRWHGHWHGHCRRPTWRAGHGVGRWWSRLAAGVFIIDCLASMVKETKTHAPLAFRLPFWMPLRMCQALKTMPAPQLQCQKHQTSTLKSQAASPAPSATVAHCHQLGPLPPHHQQQQPPQRPQQAQSGPSSASALPPQATSTCLLPLAPLACPCWQSAMAPTRPSRAMVSPPQQTRHSGRTSR